MKTRVLCASAAVCAGLALFAAPAAAQVRPTPAPPDPPQEVCDAIDTAGSELQGAEQTVSGASGESLPASAGSNVRSARFTLGCKFVDPDSSTGGSAAPDPGTDTPDADVVAAPKESSMFAPAAADAETLPVTGGVVGVVGPLGSALLALGAAARWATRRVAQLPG